MLTKSSHFRKEMSTKHIKDLIDQIAEMGILSLSFTGGEPTLRKDLTELIYHSGEVNELMTGIASNGYLLPKLLKKTGLKGLDYILLSLDFPVPELHDKIRGLKLFDKVMETLKLANKLGKHVIISTNVMKGNLKYLPELCELAKQMNCSIELYPCEDIVRKYKGKTYRVLEIEKMIPDLKKWGTLIRSLRKEYKNVLTDYSSVEIIERGGFGGIPKYQDILRCHVAEAYLFIRHDGMIDYPCKIHPIRSFDTHKYSIKKIYNSQEVREIMKKYDNFKFCDSCRLGCAITSSLPTTWETAYNKYIRGFLDGNLR